MSEQFRGDMQKNTETGFESRKFEPAIKWLIREMMLVDEKGDSLLKIDGVDISDPKVSDSEKIKAGAFTITNFRTNPVSGSDKRSFHFNVGGTEFHITGEAAEKVYEITEQGE